MKGRHVTRAEQYLGSLCERSFLSLWSYPAVYRDQGKSGAGDGKEVADLLVVFENDIIIFSDKDIAWPASKELAVAWTRWHRRAVLEGSAQLWGAERWIKKHPQRLFLDRECDVRFPLALPAPPVARIHLVLVAHGAADACRAFYGGSGSLLITPQIGAGIDLPFAVGDLDSSRTFVHVLDDTSLDVVMQHCDTVADVVAYLNAKEALVRSGSLLSAAGEEELIAHYLTHTDALREHAFVLPAGVTHVVFDEGHYEEFRMNPQLAAKQVADDVSYLWDSLIEEWSKNVLGGTLYFSSGSGVEHHERGLRVLAREPRVRRRMLSRALVEMARDPSGHRVRRVRVVSSGAADGIYYVFLCLERSVAASYDEYRTVRRNLLLGYCRTVKLKRPDALTVVGIGLDFPSPEPSSEDLLVYDASEFSAEERLEAERIQREWNLLAEVREFRATESEYPDVTGGKPVSRTRPATHRNAPCTCGSGLKYRHCCRETRSPAPTHSNG